MNTTKGGDEELSTEVQRELSVVGNELNVTIMIVKVDRFGECVYNHPYFYSQLACMSAPADGCPRDTTVIASQSGDESLAIEIKWPETNLGMTVELECPCKGLDLASTRLRATRRCGGHFSTGGQWDSPSDAACNTSDITRRICSLSNVSGLANCIHLELHRIH